jgi:hypothetical protein
LEELLGSVMVHQVTDHGDRLVEWVGEGSLDVAFVAIANQMRLPSTATAVPVARDRLSVLSTPEVSLGSRRKPFAGLDVIAYTYDMSTAALHRRLAELGARPRTAATAETAVRMGRLLRWPIVLPRGLATSYADPQDRVSTGAVPGRLTLFMVTRRPTPLELVAAATRLPARLGLEPASMSTGGT